MGNTPTLSQKVLEQLTSLSLALATHIAIGIETDKKINAMYEILVTGNDCPPLTETVRKHTEWITEQENFWKEERSEKKEKRATDERNIKTDSVEDIRYKRQLLLFGLGEIAALLFLVVTTILKWK